MRLLVVTYRMPTDLCSGDQYTIHNMVKHFSQRHEIILAAFVSSKDNVDRLDAVAPYCERVEAIPLSKAQSYRSSLTGILSSDPIQVRYYQSQEMHNRIQRIIEQDNIDVAYAYHLRSGQYLSRIKECPKVLDLKPVQTLNLKRMKDHVSNPLMRFIYKREFEKVRRYEPKLVAQFDRCLVISEKDRNEMDPQQKLSNIMINPHGLDPEHFSPDPDRTAEPGSIIFSGKMNYDPNVDAVVYFCKDVFPIIKKLVPEAKLHIVGIDPKPEVLALAKDPSVVVTGWVEDMREYMNRAQVAIDPLRIGAGLQNKVLENMSMGIPMVVSTIANEGIQATDQEHLMVADTPEVFAENTVRLLRNGPLRDQMGSAARKFIKENWTWEKHFDDLENLFFKLVKKNRDQLTNQEVELSNV